MFCDDYTCTEIGFENFNGRAHNSTSRKIVPKKRLRMLVLDRRVGSLKGWPLVLELWERENNPVKDVVLLLREFQTKIRSALKRRPQIEKRERDCNL